MNNIFLTIMSVCSITLSMLYLIALITVCIQCIKDKEASIKTKLIFLGLMMIPISMLSACIIAIVSFWFL